jgi:hypothetical protein
LLLDRGQEVTMNKTLFASALLCVLAIGCGKKKAGDIKSVCEDNFAHGEMENDKWSPGKGDKTAFMDYCVKQNPDVVRCSSMTIELGDKSCEKHTGISTDGFKVKMELGKLRNGNGGASGTGPAASQKPVEAAAAPEPPAPPQPACAANAYRHEGTPAFCMNLDPSLKPDGKGEQKRGDLVALVWEGPKYATVQVLIGTGTEEIEVRNMKQFIDFSQKGENAAPMVARGPWHGGYYFHTKTTGNSPDIHTWQYVTTGAAGSLKCLGSAYDDDAAMVAAVEAACASLQLQ